MRIVELIRLSELYGTRGVLVIEKVPFCCTLEPDDELNKRNRSSIPAQQYICERYQSSKFGETFQVMGVPGRTGILFHPGTISKGCILMAKYWEQFVKYTPSEIRDQAFDEFMKIMAKVDKFHLTVKEVY